MNRWLFTGAVLLLTKAILLTVMLAVGMRDLDPVTGLGIAAETGIGVGILIDAHQHV